MNNLGVNIFKRTVLLIWITWITTQWGSAAKISIRYERPVSAKHLEVYRSLKLNHKKILGESIRYLNRLYDWNADIEVLVTDCGYVNSSFTPPGKIVICYETLYKKVYDYPESDVTREKFDRRVFQNSLFTFWHEIGHAVIHQFQIGDPLDTLKMEMLADEFATLSMLWRPEHQWKEVVLMSALHFKHKSSIQPGRRYSRHPSDRRRYEKMITLLYGFAQKSYSRLSDQVSTIEWLDKTAHEYYLERTDYWATNLRDHTRSGFFDN